tara:strand:+ start:571 stop:873 length:303 start_codon:yes stop_codon:yes gene_type:complete
MKIKNIIDVYEKEKIMNNKLKERKKYIGEFNKNDYQKEVVNSVDLDEKYKTYERGSQILTDKIVYHKKIVKKLFLAHKVINSILIFIVLFILIFKVIVKM